MPHVVNEQVTDAMTQTNTANVAGAPSLAMGMFYQAEAQAFAIGLQNAVATQRGMQQVGEAVVAVACARLMQATEPPKP